MTFLSTFVRVVADIFANIVSNRIFDIFKNGALYEKKGFIRASDTSCRRIFWLRRGASFQQIPPGADQRSAFLLNTFVNITLYDSQDEAILDHCVDMCQEYENRFSKTIEGSELYKLNHRSADETTFTVSDDMAAMISEGLHYSEVSHGAYDLTIEPLSSLWNFTSDEHVIPAEDDITAAAERVNWKNVKLDGNTLTFLSPDTTIDLAPSPRATLPTA